MAFPYVYVQDKMQIHFYFYTFGGTIVNTVPSYYYRYKLLKKYDKLKGINI